MNIFSIIASICIIIPFAMFFEAAIKDWDFGKGTSVGFVVFSGIILWLAVLFVS